MSLPKPKKFETLSEFSKESALAHELPYWEIDRGVAVLSDGTLVRGFRIRGIDIETKDVREVNQLTHGLRSLLNSLPDGCELSFMVSVNPDVKDRIARHEAIKGARKDVNWVTENRVASLFADEASGELVNTDLYLFVYRSQLVFADNLAFGQLR